MDKQQAQFILQSFRPNGADSSAADFQEALKLAVEDRELGEWLAAERAADAAFAEALIGIEIPDHLRLNLLAIMRGELPEDPQLNAEMDEVFSGALADVQPPAGLRDQIIAAMEVERNSREQEESSKVISGVFKKRKWINVAAIAATLVLGVFFAMQIDFSDKNQLVSTDNKQGNDETRMSSYDVQRSAGKILNAEFSLDVKHESSSHLRSWLASNDLPAPSDIKDLPSGLIGLKSAGCKKIILPGEKEASLICFITQGDKMMHLIITRNETVSNTNLPSKEKVGPSNCYHCSKTNWNTVSWRGDTNTYILMSKNQPEKKQELLHFF